MNDNELPMLLPSAAAIAGMQIDLQRIFDAAPGCLLVLAPDCPRFTILAVTDAYLRATKTVRAMILGKGVFEVFPDNPDDPTTKAVDFARASFQRVVEHRRTDVMGIRKHDIRLPQAEGGGFEERFWNAVNLPVLGADGQVVCIIHSVEDVTESLRLKQKEAEQQVANIALRDSRRAAINLMEDAIAARRQAEEVSAELRQKEAELREAKEQLEVRVVERTAELTEALKALRRTGVYTRSLIEASLDPLVTIGPDGTITDVNAATEAATGRTRQELIGTDFSTYFTDPDKARTGYQRVFKEGSVRDYPLDIHRDGRTIPVLYNAALYRDEAGQVVGIFAAARDITERKQAEAQVKAERQRLYDVLETLPVYVVLLTPDYRVPFANRFFEERFGKSEGRRCYEYLFNRSEPCEICETFTVLKTGQPHHWYWTGPDGRDYDIYDFPFTDSDGSPLILEMGIDITERNRAEDALRQSELRYRTLFETMDEGFCVVEMIYDAEGKPVDYRFVEANPAFEKHIGFKNGLGRTIRELVPDYDAHWFEIYGRVARTGASTRFEEVAEAMQRFYDVFAFRIGGEENPRVGILFKDITYQKRAEKAIREAKEMLELRVAERTAELEAVLDVAPVAVWIAHDAQCSRITGNRCADELMRVPRKTNVSASAPPGEAAVTYRVFRDGIEMRPAELPAQAAAATGNPIAAEMLDLIFSDGRVVHLIEGAVPLFNAEGCVRGAIATGMDITPMRRAEQSLRESEERYQRLVKLTPIPLCFVNKDGEISYFNDRFIQVFGYDEVPTLKEWWRLACPDEQYRRWVVETWESAVRRASETSADIEPIEYYVACKDGTVRAVVISGITIEDGVLAIFVDVTERKRAEEALRRAAVELARSNEDLEQFARVASHDLQEPLRMVSGFLKLLRERYEPQLDAKAKEYIGYSVEGATRMSQLIADLLAYSRVDRRGQALRPTDAGKALAGAIANLRGSIKEAGATVTFDDLPIVRGDASQLTQLFQNLVGNAIKFRHADRPCQVHISARLEEGKWIFAARDNGIGIVKEAFDRVFVIFQRLHTREKYAGTGIGLAICKKIVERHGGKIWLQSQVGEGSTFYFTLPEGNTV